jgi:anaerobic selenocysteine-containing dehydrogenase
MKKSMKQILPSVCALDCPDTCSVLITIEDGKVTKFSGDPDHPVTRGFACVKTAKYPERQEHCERLTTPLRRCGRKGEGQFESVSWDVALDEIASKTQAILDKHGAQSILPFCYAGTMGVIESGHALALFRAMGAIELDQTICATTGSAGWEMNYGPNKLGPDPESVIHARFIILWGVNVMRSNSHLVPILKEAQRRGAKILHIDPYRNETSLIADEHWQIRVGTDAALALAFGRQIIHQGWIDEAFVHEHAVGFDDYRKACEEWTVEKAADFCGLSAERIAKVIEHYARSECSFIRIGYGMTRNEGGGNAMRAISLLPSLIGAWKRLGGGAVLSTSGAFALNKSRLGGRHLIKPGVRHVNMNQLASELERNQDAIRGLFVFNSNPAAVVPDSNRVRKGLAREDLFTVVLEHFQTDTADYADYLLPATTFLEHADLYTSYGHYHLQWAKPVVAPRGEARSNTAIFAELGKRLGIHEPTLYASTEEIAQDLLQTDHPFLEGITFERLQRERSVKLNLPSPYLPYSQGSHFEDGKIRFHPAPKQLIFEESTSAEYPFRLISPPGAFVLNTSFGNIESLLKAAGGQPRVIVHPTDAATIGLESEGMVKIVSECGSIARQALVNEQTLPGVVIALGQWWPKLAPDRKSLNDLTSERLTDLGGGSTFGNTVVRLELAELVRSR